MNLPPDGAACQRGAGDQVGTTIPLWLTGASEALMRIALDGPDGGHTATNHRWKALPDRLGVCPVAAVALSTPSRRVSGPATEHPFAGKITGLDRADGRQIRAARFAVPIEFGAA